VGVDRTREIIFAYIKNDIDKTGEIFADYIWSCAEIVGVIVL
jgi:hypothetical protein